MSDSHSLFHFKAISTISMRLDKTSKLSYHANTLKMEAPSKERLKHDELNLPRFAAISTANREATKRRKSNNETEMMKTIITTTRKTHDTTEKSIISTHVAADVIEERVDERGKNPTGRKLRHLQKASSSTNVRVSRGTKSRRKPATKIKEELLPTSTEGSSEASLHSNDALSLEKSENADDSVVENVASTHERSSAIKAGGELFLLLFFTQNSSFRFEDIIIDKIAAQSPPRSPEISLIAKLLKFPGLSVTALTPDGKQSPIKSMIMSDEERLARVRERLASRGIFTELQQLKYIEIMLTTV